MNNKDFWEAIKELSPKLFITYSVIYKLSDNEVGYCYAGNKAISEKIEKSTRRISGDLAELKKLEYLNVIEINKKGNYCEERRIYTNNNYKTFVEDEKNISNLIKTTTKKVDDILYYYNERNTDKTISKEGIDKNVYRGIDKNVYRGIDKNVHGTNTNTNLSNITTSSSFELIFKEHKIQINDQTLKNIKNINPTSERLIEVLKWANSKNQGTGAIILALEKNWKTDVKNKSKEIKKTKAAGIDYDSKKVKPLVEYSDFEIQKNRLLALLSFKLKREDLVIKARNIKDIKELNEFYVSNSLKI